MVTDSMKEKAKQLRYKKAIVKGLSLETIEFDMMDMMDACNGSDILESILGEDESQEFKIMFSSLSNDIDGFMEDIQCEWVPECYEDFMVAITGKTDGIELLGFDSYEADYFGIGDYSSMARHESQKRLERLTKRQIIEAGQQCFNIAFQYIGLRNRYDQLQASIDILRGETKGMFETINKINELHEKAFSGESYQLYRRWGYSREAEDFQKLLNSIDPYDRIWVE